jgi:hypothetical protein
LGQSELEEKCRTAFQHEQEHLENVRAWLSAITLEEAAPGAKPGRAAETAGAENKKPAKPRAQKKSQTSKARSAKPKKTKTKRKK